MFIRSSGMARIVRLVIVLSFIGAACGLPGTTTGPEERPRLSEADIRATVQAEVRATQAAADAAPPPVSTPVTSFATSPARPDSGAEATLPPSPTIPPPTAAAEPTAAATALPRMEATPEATESAIAPTEVPAPTAVLEPTTAVEPTVAASPAPAGSGETRLLEDRWYVDGDGDGAPDFLETDLGFNPNGLDCVSRTCGSGARGAELLRRERNTLLMLDSSGSMAGRVGGETKLDAAKGALRRYVATVSGLVNLGFLVYGHEGNNTEAGKAESCRGIDLLDPIGEAEPQTFGQTLDRFQPTGWTPIAAALREAERAFEGREDATNRIVLVSDGIETCGGDPVAVARALHDRGFAVEIDVIGFDIAQGSADARQLREIARVTGGTYYDAKTAQDLNDYFDQQGKALGETLDALICEVNSNFNASLCDYQFQNKVVAEVNTYADRVYATDFEEWQAYQDISDRVREEREGREEARRDAAERIEELQKQYDQLIRQLNRAQDR